MLTANLGHLLIWLWPAAFCIAGYAVYRLVSLKREMEATGHRLELVLTGTKVGSWDWTVDNNKVMRNRGYGQLLGYTERELTDQVIFASELIHPEDVPRLKRAMDDYLSGKAEKYEVAYRLRSSEGDWRWVLDRGVVTNQDRSGNPIRMVGITIDIHDQKTTELYLEELSYLDPVTGLYNRAFFDKAIRELDREEALPLSIIMGDLNGLKLTNDTFGHAAGDELLVDMADVLRATCRKTDILTRWGGDEFAIILPNTTEAQALTVCERIREACRAVQGSPIRLSIALGVATRRAMDEPLPRVLRSAEEWMYQHKLAESDYATNTMVLSISAALEEKYQDGMERGARQETLALEVGKALGLSRQELEDLALLARMHDIGHVMTPEEILFKANRTPEEEQIYQQHVEGGFRVARALPQLRPIAETILAHHEHWDGSGYPKGLKGEEIPLNARIIGLVDAYDDLLFGWARLTPVSVEEALAEVSRGAGTKFDPKLVAVFREIVQANAMPAS
ncbi:MAG TPA: diguanylate cyclase [Firmicutes bacterium]|nr:diguanylate cyclase [Bacillota bacterium]